MKNIGDYVNESNNEMSSEDFEFIKKYPNIYYRKEDRLNSLKKQLQKAKYEYFDNLIINFIESKINELQKALQEGNTKIRQLDKKYGEDAVSAIIDKYDTYSM